MKNICDSCGVESKEFPIIINQLRFCPRCSDAIKKYAAPPENITMSIVTHKAQLEPHPGCCDCGDDLYQMFVVNDKLWKEHGVGADHICLYCFEKRLGRKITLSDLSRSARLNDHLITMLERLSK